MVWRPSQGSRGAGHICLSGLGVRLRLPRCGQGRVRRRAIRPLGNSPFPSRLLPYGRTLRSLRYAETRRQAPRRAHNEPLRGSRHGRRVGRSREKTGTLTTDAREHIEARAYRLLQPIITAAMAQSGRVGTELADYLKASPSLGYWLARWQHG
jgi:hypothetical protein